MDKTITCIECPQGCQLTVVIDNNKVVSVAGNQCPKGDNYAQIEIECPCRIFTSTVRTKGLSLKMVPVRTDQPIPKAYLFQARKELKKIIVTEPVRLGQVLIDDLLDLGVKVIITRSFRD
jgi:CxxC motif-containing protein